MQAQARMWEIPQPHHVEKKGREIFPLTRTSEEVIICMTSQKITVWNEAIAYPWHQMGAGELPTPA